MTSDLVARLRHGPRPAGAAWVDAAMADMQLAADELERLRSSLALFAPLETAITEWVRRHPDERYELTTASGKIARRSGAEWVHAIHDALSAIREAREAGEKK